MVACSVLRYLQHHALFSRCRILLFHLSSTFVDSVLIAMQHKLWFVFCFEIFWSFVHATCYFPNGEEMIMPGVEFFECEKKDKSQEHTMCCGKGDTCRSDGLCNSVWYRGVFRNGCTDPTWKSPSCVKLCTSGSLSTSVWNGDTRDLNNTGLPVTLCDDGSYCCGDDETAAACCAFKLGVFIQNGTAIPHYAVPASAISIPISTVIVTTAESYSISVTTTLFSEASSSPSSPATTLSISAPSPLSAAQNGNGLSTNPTGSSSATKSRGPTGTIMGGAIGGVAVVLVLVFGNWRHLDL